MSVTISGERSVELSARKLTRPRELIVSAACDSRAMIGERLSSAALDATRHRLLTLPTGELALAYRTWRISFEIKDMRVVVTRISSGYTEADLASEEDKYHDKAVHRAFNHEQF